MKTQWLKICEDLQNRLNPGTYKVWVAPLTADLEGEGKIRLSAPNGFVATWVRDRLLNDISDAASAIFGRTMEISVVAGNPPAKPSRSVPGRPAVSVEGEPAPARRPRTAPAPRPVAAPSLLSSAAEQLSLPITMPVNQSVPHNWRYAFDSFVVGPTNDMAYAAARNMARSGAAVDTLFLSSGPGLGKTHLTQAVGQALCEASNRSNPNVEYLTAEEFSSCFVQALQSRTVDRFKGRFRDVDLLLLEDVHFLQGKEKMQDEVLSTIKSLQEKGSRVVLTSSFAPCELRNVDNSLVSRFCSGFLAGIEKPDASTRRRILQEKARQNNALLSDTVVDVLTERLTGDIRQLESCVHNLLLKAVFPYAALQELNDMGIFIHGKNGLGSPVCSQKGNSAGSTAKLKDAGFFHHMGKRGQKDRVRCKGKFFFILPNPEISTGQAVKAFRFIHHFWRLRRFRPSLP